MNITTAIAEFSPFEASMQELKARYDGVVYDLEDEAQNKQARSDRLAIGKVVSKLDASHKNLKAPLKAQTDLLDSERKRIKDDLLGIQGRIKSQIAEHERKQREHAEMLQDKVDFIAGLAIFENTPAAVVVKSRLSTLDSTAVDDSYEHRKADATLAQVDARKVLESELANAKKREAEQAELERLRKEAEDRAREEREEKIRQAAAERARKDEQRKASAALEKADQDKREAQLMAQRAIDNAEREAEAAVAREQARALKERQDAERAEARRKAILEKLKREKAHIDRIHTEVKRSLLITAEIEEGGAGRLVALMATGKIAHVRIEY